jgi:haloalkane dehalogenase
MSLIDTGFAHHEVRVGSQRIAYVDEGDGPPVVMVHGSPISSTSFREQIAALSPQFRVIAPDQPGFGRSFIPSQGVDFTDQAAALRGLFDHLALDSFRLVVHDWGGPTGMAAVSDRLHHLKQVVFVNTTIRPDFAAPLWSKPLTSVTGELLVVKLNLVSRTLSSMMRSARQPEKRAHYRALLDPLGTRRTMLRLERLEGYAPLMEDVRQALRGTSIPARIIWGTPDTYFSDREIEYLQTGFPGAAVVKIPGGGHFCMEDAPRALGDALIEYLSE